MSWRLRVARRLVRALVRERYWGDERALAQRARKLFGSPRPWAVLMSRGVTITAIAENGVRGEWLVPWDPHPGVLLYIHGGGYVSCSPMTHRPITAALAKRTRRRVLSVDYRLAPEHRFPAALDDVMAAYRVALAAAPRGVAVAGDSAGGGLALALCERARTEGLSAPACVVCFSPWTDLTGSSESVRTNAERDAMFHPANIAQFASAYLGTAPPRASLASPMFAAPFKLPPSLFHVGAEELLLDDARQIHQRARQSGSESYLRIFKGAFHGWQQLYGVVPEATASIAEASDFIHRHLD